MRQRIGKRDLRLTKPLVFKTDNDALVVRALAAGLEQGNLADLSRVGHVGSTISLQVEAYNIDRPHSRDTLREQVDLGTNEVWYLERFITG